VFVLRGRHPHDITVTAITRDPAIRRLPNLHSEPTTKTVRMKTSTLACGNTAPTRRDFEAEGMTTGGFERLIVRAS
jgi:hypothetical protein